MLTFAFHTSTRGHARHFSRCLRLKQPHIHTFNGASWTKTLERRNIHLTRTQLFPSGQVHTTSNEAKYLAPSDAQRKTIYALATPSGKGGVAVIRVSGPEALGVYHRMIRPWSKKAAQEKVTPVPRKMLRCAVYDPVTGEDIDDGLAVFFPAPHSFTTEDVLEIHIHSGRAVITSILNALNRISNPPLHSNTDKSADQPPLLLRPAERGEFTRRAFLGGRLDLTQAEALRDLVNAETEAQRRMALRAARGSTRERFEKIRTEIIRAMAMTEALIDFSEGDDIEEGVFKHAREIVTRLQDEIAKHLAESKRGEILRSGLQLTIFGPPNAGKSSLLNFLAGREAAIVTSVPGTTRDILEITLDFNGLAVNVADTAGIRETDDIVEQIGVHRAHGRLSESDISLCVLSLMDALENGIPQEVKALLGPTTSVIFNKADLISPNDHASALRLLPPNIKSWIVSLTTNEGLEDFMEEYGRSLSDEFITRDDSNEPLLTQARHRRELENAQEFLTSFLATDDVVVGAEELRYAANAIGKITGNIDVEDILDVIFREFCIGK